MEVIFLSTVLFIIITWSLSIYSTKELKNNTKEYLEKEPKKLEKEDEIITNLKELSKVKRKKIK